MPLLEDATQATVPLSHGATWIWRAAAAFFLITTAAVSLFYFRERRPSPVELTRFQIPLPESVMLPPPPSQFHRTAGGWFTSQQVPMAFGGYGFGRWIPWTPDHCRVRKSLDPETARYRSGLPTAGMLLLKPGDN